MIIGLDVGGTHTDVVLLGQEGLVRQIKVTTNPSDLFATVLTGLEKITEGIDPARISRAVLSTTLATNRIVQGRIPEVGMIVSSGPGMDPELFRTGPHYHAVTGAINHRGREITPIDEGQVLKAADSLKKNGIRHVGVVSKFSVRNPAHELAVGDLLGDRFEKVFLGHRIAGHLNFPRRIATTFLNASVYPIHKDFFEAVVNSLAKKGLSVPIRILKPDGGNMRFDASIDHPAQTILSGPAASVMGSVAFAPKDEVCLVLDIGGTTTDMAVLVNGVPLLDPMGISIGDHKTLIRSLETVSIGVGGDSAVRVVDGKIHIGPDRLGMAMAYGGPVPTPTDAIFLLGIGHGGDPEKAREAIQSVAQALGTDLQDAANRIFDQACRTILDEAGSMVERINAKPVYTVHELWEGHRLQPRKILVLGGPAPWFATGLERLSESRVTVVPRWTVANAIGAGLARTTCEVTFFADTEREIATAPEENFTTVIPSTYTKEDAVDATLDLLRRKAIARGANPEHLELEVTEAMSFNMVRGFYTTGRNIRVTAQVKPGLIHGYDPIAEKIMDSSFP
ncbi:hydantoinase/oxoprolinase family protein [Desulfosarcina sp.]|uniref:hydantoinase/oxoprolinase family protein n=1 Tax=Desulfosarcina sp. TaxID=2027861 RepID=UPI0029B7FA6E|nr:hydantoinase/oxoprolinase family protein [Desulfosarcina sp.]MDX2451990.1 hydantoinase/oxoprolinase family protein [Desulfosarcina sp.]MDX2489774.1 hydantoinase/oxoprolinase family protein [Desulfosarcina sp.]